MSKLRCHCGHLISDSAQNDSDRFWGSIVKNGDRDVTMEIVAGKLAELCVAFGNGRHQEWLSEHCPVHTEQPLSDIISDMITSLTSDLGTNYARCPECATLMIQKNRSENIFVAYQPLDGLRCEEI